MKVSIKITDDEKSNATTVIIITLDRRPTAEGAITHTSVWNSVKTVSSSALENIRITLQANNSGKERLHLNRKKP